MDAIDQHWVTLVEVNDMDAHEWHPKKHMWFFSHVLLFFALANIF
jgi:hypothetical protein